MLADPANEISANFVYGANTCTITLNDNIGSCRVLFSVCQAFNILGARASFALTAVSNCTVPTPVWGLNNFQAPGSGESTTRQTWQTYIDCTGGGPASFTFTQTSPTGVLQVYLNMTTMDSGIGRLPLIPYIPWVASVSATEHTDVEIEEAPMPGAYLTSTPNDETEKDQWDSADMSQSTAMNIAEIVEKARQKKLASLVHK